MGVNKLTGLHLPKQLFCVSAHITGNYFITHDLSFGVDDKRAALCKTVCLNQHLKVLGNAVGRVSQHGIIDLFDSLRRIVPCLVDEMGISRQGINLTADGFKLLVLVRQILQFRRTHKGKVRRIEEKHTPFAQDILLGHKFEIVLVERVDAKIGNFLIDHRHNLIPPKIVLITKCVDCPDFIPFTKSEFCSWLVIRVQMDVLNPVLGFQADPFDIVLRFHGMFHRPKTNTIVFVNYTQPNNTTISGYAISVMYVGMSLGAMILGPLADRFEPKHVLTGSLILTGIGCAILFLFSEATSVLLLMASLGILGFGLGGNGTIFMKVALSGLPQQEAGAGTGTYGLFRDLAAPFGVAVFVPLFTNQITGRIAGGASRANAAIASIHQLAIAELLCIAAGIAVVLFLPRIRNKGASR